MKCIRFISFYASCLLFEFDEIKILYNCINMKFQLGQAQGTLPRISTSSQIQRQRTATALTSSSYSGEMLASSTESTCSTSVTTSSGHVPGAPPLSMSTSLDTMVHLLFHLYFIS